MKKPDDVCKLLKACELRETAINELFEELGKKRAADWGLVNDSLCEATRLVAEVKGLG